MNNISLQSLKKYLPNDCKIIGNTENININNIKSIVEADENSIVWLNPTRKDKEELIKITRACIIIADRSLKPNNNILEIKCFILVDNPKLAYIRIIEKFFQKRKTYKIHQTAIIDEQAAVDNEVHIGEYAVIGECKIGKGSFIDSFCKIGDNTVIGKNVTIHSGVKIGTDGFGYAKNEIGEFIKFPHVGGVVIENDVEIGANTCIDKGTLGNTIIKANAKIDNLVHIAHNVVVGNNAVIIAGVTIGGSVTIEENVWIGLSSVLTNGVTIQSGAFIGAGANVLTNVSKNTNVIGMPGKHLLKRKE